MCMYVYVFVCVLLLEFEYNPMNNHDCQVVPLGGTHIDPVTKQLVPIEIGSLMLDSKTKECVPIIGVDINYSKGNRSYPTMLLR